MSLSHVLSKIAGDAIWHFKYFGLRLSSKIMHQKSAGYFSMFGLDFPRRSSSTVQEHLVDIFPPP
jgi:hypothetical protein